jgi:mannose-6-phosphate isomerase-like protein (cupin superfamily)
MRLIRVVLSVCLLAAIAFAQDPLKTLPNAYKLEFENEYVRVVRVHYAPHEKLPAHEHTLTASAYVYLNDGGPVVFNHIDKEYGAVTRPATKAGSFRVYRGIQEHHEVENQSDLPSDFLRVEFKTAPLDEKSLKGRYYREDYPAGENYQKVQFENAQIRITRLICVPGKRIEMAAGANAPELLIALSSAQFKVRWGKGKTSQVKLGLGQTRWVPVYHPEQLENTGSAPAEMLRFDFKTKPLSKAELEKDKRHEHPDN